MTVEINDSRPIVVNDKRRVPIQIEREALDLPSVHHIVMYMTLLGLAGAESRTAPGLRRLAQSAKMGHTKAAEVLRDLEEMRVIRRHRTTSPNGMSTRTVITVLGLDGLVGVRVTDTPAKTLEIEAVRETDGLRLTTGVRHAETRREGVIRHADSNEQEEVLLSQQEMELTSQLTAEGISRSVALQLAVEAPIECSKQLALISLRPGVRDRAATLVKSIREAWTAPVQALGRDEVVQFSAEMFAFPKPEPVPCVACDGTRFVDAPQGAGMMTTCPVCMTMTTA